MKSSKPREHPFYGLLSGFKNKQTNSIDGYCKTMFCRWSIIITMLLLPLGLMAQVRIGQSIIGEARDDFSGMSVSLSADGTVVAIGADKNDGNGTDSGHVRVYQNNAGTWTQLGQDIDGEGTYDHSGDSVSLSADGSVVAIGASENSGNGTNSGHVRVYQNNAGTWTQIGQDIDGGAALDYSGYSVSLSADGSVVAIGAPFNNDNGIFSGHVRVYQNNAGTWTQQGGEIDGEASYDSSGMSVSLSADGSVVAIGAPYNNLHPGISSGYARVYQNNAGTWTQLGQDIDGEGIDDRSGISVSLSADGTVVAIGADKNDDNGTDSGHVRVYQNNAGIWTQIGQDIDGAAEGDRFGLSVSLNADGSVVAIGAIYNDGNGNDSGHVRVYQNNAGTWTQLGWTIYGAAEGDISGKSVSLSADGSVVAIGAPNNDGFTDNFRFGHVRVYEFELVSDTPPTSLCNAFTVVLNTNGQAIIQPSDVDGGSFDEEGSVTLSLDIDTFTCVDLGDNTVTLTVTDTTGNEDSCTATVTVADNEDPVITCATAQIQNTDIGVCEANVTVISPTVEDNCSSLQLGNSLAFDGVDDQVEVPNSPSLNIGANTVTLETWVYINTLPSELTTTYGSIYDSSQDAYILYLDKGENELRFKVTDTDGTAERPGIPGTDLVSGKWLHIAGVYNGNQGTASIYLNGELKDVHTNAGLNDLVITGQKAYLGSQNSVDFFNGKIDEVRIWNLAKTQSDIQAAMNQELTGEENGLMAYFNFNQGIAGGDNTNPLVNTLIDNSGNGNTGTLNSGFALNGQTSNWVDGLNDSSPLLLTNDYTNAFNASGTYPVGTTTVTWTATDASGNTATCEQLITVEDNEKPVVTCVEDSTRDTDPGACNYTIVDTELDATFTDNCEGGSITNSLKGTATLADEVFETGDTTVTWTVDDGNGQTTTCTTTITVEDNEEPVVTCVENDSRYIDPYQTFYTVQGDEFDATATDNCGVDSLTYIGGLSNSSGSSMSNVQLDLGINTMDWTAIDNNGNESYCSTTITVVKRPTSLTYNGDTDEQYSDSVNLSATLIDDVSGSGVQGKTITFNIGSQSTTAVTDGSGIAAATLILTQDPAVIYTVKSEFLEDASYLSSTDEDNFDITQEDAIVEYTGQSLQATQGSNSSTATVVLSANIQDITITNPDPDVGDIRNAKVKFVNRDGGDISGWLDVSLIDPADSTTGTVSFDWAVDIGSQTSESFTVGIIVDGYYLKDSSEDDTVVTVYVPDGDFITGGGYILPYNSSGQYASTDGLKTNFGFNVKYTKKGNKPKGHMNIIFRRLEADGIVHVYQIKSNAVNSLGVDIADENAKYATFITKSNLKDNTDPLNPVSLGGNLILKVDMTDRGQPGFYDSIAFNLTGGGTLLYSSNWTGIITDEMQLSGGNLVVHSGFSTTSRTAPITDVDTVSDLFEVKTWPNPTDGYFNLELKTANRVDKVNIFVIDLNRRLVHVDKFDANQQYQFGDGLQSGIYFVRLSQANNTKTIRVIKY